MSALRSSPLHLSEHLRLKPPELRTSAPPGVGGQSGFLRARLRNERLRSQSHWSPLAAAGVPVAAPVQPATHGGRSRCLGSDVTRPRRSQHGDLMETPSQLGLGEGRKTRIGAARRARSRRRLARVARRPDVPDASSQLAMLVQAHKGARRTRERLRGRRPRRSLATDVRGDDTHARSPNRARRSSSVVTPSPTPPPDSPPRPTCRRTRRPSRHI